MTEAKLRRHEAVTIDGYTYNGQAIGHAFDDYGGHAIIIGDQIGEWQPYTGIAHHGPWYATTEYYEGVLPRLFRVTEVKRQ